MYFSTCIPMCMCVHVCVRVCVFVYIHSDDGELPSDAFDALCKEWGYTRSELHFHYKPLFEQHARAPSPPDGEPPTTTTATATTAASPTPSHADERPARGSASGAVSPGPGRKESVSSSVPVVLDFCTFVDVFMREPKPEHRFKEIPVPTNIMVSYSSVTYMRAAC